MNPAEIATCHWSIGELTAATSGADGKRRRVFKKARSSGPRDSLRGQLSLTAGGIAGGFRRRGVGSVFVDLCAGLGIVTSCVDNHPEINCSIGKQRPLYVNYVLEAQNTPAP